jgi:hypothetical protein
MTRKKPTSRPPLRSSSFGNTLTKLKPHISASIEKSDKLLFESLGGKLLARDIKLILNRDHEQSSYIVSTGLSDYLQTVCDSHDNTTPENLMAVIKMYSARDPFAHPSDLERLEAEAASNKLKEIVENCTTSLVFSEEEKDAPAFAKESYLCDNFLEVQGSCIGRRSIWQNRSGFRRKKRREKWMTRVQN